MRLPSREIRRVITEIIDKTRTLGRFGKNTRHKLKETTEALEMLRRDFEQARTEASVDFLTGVANRKAFESTLAASIREAATLNDPLSLLLIDIDLFKRFNDEFGHLIGDEVLRFTARKIREMVKGTDFVARFGGEEFAVLLPRTPLAGAAHVAETIRAFFAQATLETKATSKSLGTITVSIGVACHRPPESPEDFVRRSDEALYFAKKNGKNRLATRLTSKLVQGRQIPRWKSEGQFRTAQAPWSQRGGEEVIIGSPNRAHGSFALLSGEKADNRHKKRNGFRR